MLRIESDFWRLWCLPACGAQWMAAEVKHEERWQAVMPDCRDGRQPDLAAANFLMLPYSNRVRDGRFDFRGRTIQLQNAQNHAIHGALRKLPWTIEFCDDSTVHCSISHSDHPELNWPWPIDAHVVYQTEGNSLSSRLSLYNRGDSDMPAGLGWHPYFLRQVQGSAPCLTLPVSGVFPDASGDCLPDGPAIGLPEHLDFTRARRLDADQRIDACLAGLHGPCMITWPGTGIRLQMKASSECRFLVLYNPDRAYFAVEPVTNANDGFNLDARGVDAGVRVLRPGDSLEASFELTLESD